MTAHGGTKKESAGAAPATASQEFFTRTSYELELRTEAEPEDLRLVAGLLNHERRQVNVNQPEGAAPGDADAGAHTRGEVVALDLARLAGIDAAGGLDARGDELGIE